MASNILPQPLEHEVSKRVHSSQTLCASPPPVKWGYRCSISFNAREAARKKGLWLACFQSKVGTMHNEDNPGCTRSSDGKIFKSSSQNSCWLLWLAKEVEVDKTSLWSFIKEEHNTAQKAWMPSAQATFTYSWGTSELAVLWQTKDFAAAFQRGHVHSDFLSHRKNVSLLTTNSRNTGVEVLENLNKTLQIIKIDANRAQRCH